MQVYIVGESARASLRSARRAAEWLALTAEQEREVCKALRECRPFEAESPAVLVTRLMPNVRAMVSLLSALVGRVLAVISEGSSRTIQAKSRLLNS